MPRRALSWLPVWFAALGLAGIGGGTGCGGVDGSPDQAEGRHPLIQQAQRRERAADFAGAIERYEQALHKEPGLGKAHLQLGLLYDEHQEDYLRALYHYQTYLELRPDSEKADLVRELIAHAKLSYAASLPERPSEAIRHIARLEKDLATLEQDLAASREEIVDLQRALEGSRQEVAQLRKAAAERPQVARDVPRPSGPAAEARTYEVRSGDTLSRIASRVYNDSSKWRAIYQANRDVLQRPEDLSVGQVLRIP